MVSLGKKLDLPVRSVWSNSPSFPKVLAIVLTLESVSPHQGGAFLSLWFIGGGYDVFNVGGGCVLKGINECVVEGGGKDILWCEGRVVLVGGGWDRTGGGWDGTTGRPTGPSESCGGGMLKGRFSWGWLSICWGCKDDVRMVCVGGKETMDWGWLRLESEFDIVP